MRRQNQIGAALAITSSIIWSGNFIVSRYAINLAGPVSLAFMRWTVATLFMLPFAYKNVKKVLGPHDVSERINNHKRGSIKIL